MPNRRRPPAAGLAAGKRPVESRIRVIGGSLRGRTIPYNGDFTLRPMKDRVREAVFNLVGPRVVGKQVLDLFAGTGAMSFEAVSRGAAAATVLERKFPTAKLIESTAAEFGVSGQIEVHAGDTFIWAQRLPVPAVPWLIFCCPPYDFFLSRRRELEELAQGLWQKAPAESLLVVESDERFNPEDLLPGADWDVRRYPPAVIGVLVKTAEVTA